MRVLTLCVLGLSGLVQGSSQPSSEWVWPSNPDPTEVTPSFSESLLLPAVGRSGLRATYGPELPQGRILPRLKSSPAVPTRHVEGRTKSKGRASGANSFSDLFSIIGGGDTLQEATTERAQVKKMSYYFKG